MAHQSGSAPVQTLEVVPGLGVPPLLLGMCDDEVKRTLGNPADESPYVWYSFGSCLMINLEDGRVSYIELNWCDAHFDVRYQGVSVFHTYADELVRIISGALPEKEDYTFEDIELELGLWRPVVPSDCDPEDPDDEYRKGAYWQTIGVGRGGFFSDRAARHVGET